MKRMSPLVLLFVALLLFPAGLFAAQGGTAAKAPAKGKNLYIYGTLEQKTAQTLVQEFNSLHPEIKVDFITLTSAEVFSRHLGDLAARKVSADILWNSDIALQAALVRDGYAQSYRPEPHSGLLSQAMLADTAFATGFEPVVFAYNRKLVNVKELPLTRKQLLKMLEKPEWRGKLAVCDPEKSVQALLLLTQDLAHTPDFWGMVTRFGTAGLKIYPDYGTLLERIASGEVFAGYNVPLAAVLKRGAVDDTVGWLYTSDYTLALPQSALITRVATNPVAARLWIDFILSVKAQQILSESGDLYPVDKTVSGGAMKKSGGELPSGVALKMVGTGPEVSRFSDSGLKKGFILRWKQKLKLVK
ncbi:MAG: ABC transporter substrate-binding protein [Geobacter sp.]|nr:ABC transporter substrate-binding protein [Geobacter sp.]